MSRTQKSKAQQTIEDAERLMQQIDNHELRIKPDANDTLSGDVT